jgi:hypothetical protein
MDRYQRDPFQEQNQNGHRNGIDTYAEEQLYVGFMHAAEENVSSLLPSSLNAKGYS